MTKNYGAVDIRTVGERVMPNADKNGWGKEV